MTKHCVKKIVLAKAIGEDRMKRLDDNDFTIKSLQDKEYKAVLTNNKRFPSCKCADWKKSMLPYKESFVAIFAKIDGLDWNSFSVNYRNSPYFCLNIKNQILNKCEEEFSICENEDPEPVCKNDYESLVYFLTHYPKSSIQKDQKHLCPENCSNK